MFMKTINLISFITFTNIEACLFSVTCTPKPILDKLAITTLQQLSFIEFFQNASNVILIINVLLVLYNVLNSKSEQTCTKHI